MILNVIIVDDEHKAAKSLQNIIIKHIKEVNILDIAHDVESAEILIRKLKPDLVFLDIVMPEESGFELLKKFQSIDFEIIFVTSHDEYALNAIKCCALGYILKPADVEELRYVIQLAVQRRVLKDKEKMYEALLINLDVNQIPEHQIAINDKKGVELIKVKDIICCEGWNGYTKIHTVQNKPVISAYNIGRYISLLEKYSFILVHKSFLVNKNHITKILNTNQILMSNNAQIPISVRKRLEISNILKIT